MAMFIVSSGGILIGSSDASGRGSSEASGGAGRAIVGGEEISEQYLIPPGRGEETVSL